MCQSLFQNDVDIFGLLKQDSTGTTRTLYTMQTNGRLLLHTRLVTSTSSINQIHTHNMVAPPVLLENGLDESRNRGMDSHGLGRWSYVSITGKNGCEILIATIYQACRATISTIGSKTWILTMASDARGEQTPDPRKEIHSRHSDDFFHLIITWS
jgi:hypothetical protein